MMWVMDVPPVVEPPQDSLPPLPNPPPSNVDILDKICAGIVAISGLCTGLAVFFITGLLSMMGGASSGDPSMDPMMQGYQRFMGAIMFACLAFAGLEFVIAYGLWKKRKWAFIAAIALYTLSALGSSKNALLALVSVAIVVYCAFRISGNFGPRPI